MLYGSNLTLAIISAFSLVMVFAACCLSLVRYVRQGNEDAILSRMALLWIILFLICIVGGLLVFELFGYFPLAVFCVVAGVCSFVASWILHKRWELAQRVECETKKSMERQLDELSLTAAEKDFALLLTQAAKRFGLTRREEEILEMLLEGKSYSEISERLFISLNTTKGHVKSLYKKTGVSKREELPDRLHPTATKRSGAVG